MRSSLITITARCLPHHLTLSPSSRSRRGGLEPVQHPRHGGDRAEQAGEWPGLRSHPEAAHLRRRPRAEGDHAASPETLAGRDPEETGCRPGEEEGVWSVFLTLFFRFNFILRSDHLMTTFTSR